MDSRVRAQGRFWVLDSLSSRVVDAAAFRHFDPIITLSADRKWVHGYVRGVRAQRAAADQFRPRDASSVHLAAVLRAQRPPAQRPSTGL